jgi:16S rRNA (cytosine967-C5)-methyltransferase
MTAPRQSSPKKIAKTAPKNRPSEISFARKAAFDILIAVECGQAHADDLLRDRTVNALSAPDRNLATALVLGVLRWQIRLDQQFRPLLKRPSAKLDPEILIAFRLGAFQLLFLDRIPARAAIDESVELTKRSGRRFAAGMVNAVLRKLASAPNAAEKLIGDSKKRQSTTSVVPQTQQNKEGALAPEEIPPEQTAPTQAHPAWMVERWTAIYGLEAAHAICLHGQTQPVLTIRIASPGVEAELTAAGIELAPGELLTDARAVVSGDITSTAAFLDGRIRLQDEGSQLVAELAANEALSQEVKSIVDTCAAPGGKTLILAERNPQARILACESSPQRLDQLRQRLAAHADQVECRLADATALAEDAPSDLAFALADVPCSGTGTLGRNPEIRHRLRPEDLPRQAERQRAILAAALRSVRPGGHVVYSTCSLEPEENEQVLAAVLAETPSARQISLDSRLDSLLGKSILTPVAAARLHQCLTPQGALRLLPGVFHTDGFFIALLEKFA